MALQYSLPRRRKVQKSGILREVKREWQRHRAFIRRHQCVVADCEGEPIEVSHIRTAANAGTGIKPHDAFSVSMCHDHHQLYHNIGHDTFEKRFGLNLKALSAEFAKRSPDVAMRESLKLVPHTGE